MARTKKLVAPAVATVLAIGLAACAGPEIVDDSAGRGLIAVSYLEDDPTAINAVLADPEVSVEVKGPVDYTPSPTFEAENAYDYDGVLVYEVTIKNIAAGTLKGSKFEIDALATWPDAVSTGGEIVDPEAGVGPFEGTLKEGEEVTYKVGYVFVDTPGIIQLTWVDSNDPERAVFIFGAPPAGS